MSRGEARLWGELWPLLLASAVGLFPFTVYSTFLVPIAGAAGGDVAAVGALRGLGGVCALGVGVAVAPLMGRFAERRLGALALALLAASSLAALHGSYAALVVFCAGVGTATAVLTPALLSAAAGRYDDEAVSGRAATLVTAAQSLAAVAAGPVIGLIAWQGGWRGCLIVTAAVAGALAVGFARGGGAAPDRDGGPPPSYLHAFRRIAARPSLLGLIAAAALRTVALMGCLAYLAAWFEHRFSLEATVFTLVWTLSGLSFFLGNYGAGRWIGSSRHSGRAHAVLLGGLAAALAGLAGLFWAPTLPVALAGAAVQSFGHALAAAAITSLIVRRGGEVTAPALSLNAAGMSLGVFGGAALGGAGLALAGYAGLAGALVLPLAAALLVASALAAARERAAPETARAERGSAA
ncbi:MFS transporter [Glycomyces tenuis]|uniref:MFS transporter n=1 Tax=Glycomyces tenuis TaxID=58116 RepID=UPI00040DFCEE|nr:MFS transporter [Glycomyces tenuis]